MATTKTTTRKTAAKPKAEADITIAIEPPKPISVDLGDTRYTVRPIKGSLGLQMAQRMQSVSNNPEKLNEAVESLVSTMFGKADAPKVLARIESPDDPLDIMHIMDLMNALVERSTGTPTT